MALQDDPDENWAVRDSHNAHPSDQANSTGQWELTNARDGYSIKNVASGTFLGVSVTEQFPPYYEVNSKGEGHKSWSLNPISFPGKQMYQ